MDIKFNKKIIIEITLFLFIAVALFTYARNVKEEGFEIEVLAKNLDTPWAMDFLPGGDLIFTERDGRVSILKDGKVTVVGEIEVYQKSESGLLGIAVDRQFTQNNYIYLYYTYDKGNRVSRFTLNKNLKLEKEFVLLENIPSAKYHDGGRIKFGPDGMLYVTTGDAIDPKLSQDIDSLAGKILRINKDGTVPEDNPFNSYIYSYGHRNPQGLAWSGSGELFASEHGQRSNDEINVIIKGKNYGWPNAECDEVSKTYINPVRCFSEFTLAPSGISFYKDNLYVAGLRGAQLREIVFDKDGKKVLKEKELFDNLGRIREVVAYGGYLYIATNNRDGRGVPVFDDDKIIRMKRSK